MLEKKKKTFAHSPRQRRYNCDNAVAYALIGGQEYAIANFSKFGLSISVPQDKRSFPAQFEVTIVHNGKSILVTIGTFRHRKVLQNQKDLAFLGISLADEVPIELLIAASESQFLANKVRTEVANLTQITPQLRECLDQVFLTFREISNNVKKIFSAYPELTLPEQANLRSAFTNFSQLETANTLKKIGTALEPHFAVANEQQKDIFVKTLQRRLKPFFENVSFVRDAEEFPFLYPGHTDIAELKRNQRFDMDDLMSSLVSSMILESKSIDARLQLEIKLAEELCAEFKRSFANNGRQAGSAFNVLFLCAGYGQTLDNFFSQQTHHDFAKLNIKFIDFLERPLLRNQAKLQKIGAAAGQTIQASYQHHLTGEAASSPFDDLVMTFDFKPLAETQDCIVVPWLADYIEPSLRLSLALKLQSTLKSSGLILIGKTPPPRPMFDLMPLLFDWNIEYANALDFVAATPSGLEHSGNAIDANSSRHWIFKLRKSYGTP